jgi:ABC-type polysaccharide/polyol phosphate transport system ATPase subunit
VDERGALIVISCHDEEKLREYSDVILTMENGRIVDSEDPAY